MTDIDAPTAQATLDRHLFPHYVLGRQLALEQVVRELLGALPPKKRQELTERLQSESDVGMALIRDQNPQVDTEDHVARCGYVASLLEMGF